MKEYEDKAALEVINQLGAPIKTIKQLMGEFDD